MLNTEKFKNLILSLTIFTIPFLEFIKNNFNEIDIIVGKSFYVLIISVVIILLSFSFILNFFIKKINYLESFLISTVIYWIFFKHNTLSSFIKNFLKSNILGNEFSSEISLLILLILSSVVTIFIYKKDIFFKRFISIFFSLCFKFLY